jgi:hypothetical protein
MQRRVFALIFCFALVQMFFLQHRFGSI